MVINIQWLVLVIRVELGLRLTLCHLIHNLLWLNLRMLFGNHRTWMNVKNGLGFMMSVEIDAWSQNRWRVYTDTKRNISVVDLGHWLLKSLIMVVLLSSLWSEFWNILSCHILIIVPLILSHYLLLLLRAAIDLNIGFLSVTSIVLNLEASLLIIRIIRIKILNPWAPDRRRAHVEIMMVVLTILIFRRTTIRTKAITSIFILSLALYLKFLILKCVAAIVLHTSSLVLLRRSAEICTPS